jgi:hypothetical protein
MTAVIDSSHWPPQKVGDWCSTVKDKPTPTYYLQPIIPADACVMISGRQKISRKSYFCRKLAIKLALGAEMKPWGKPIAPLPVLYFDQEGPEKLSEIRWRALERSEGVSLCDIPALYYTHRDTFMLDNEASVMRVIKFIESAQVKVVILDPLAKLHQCDENDEQDLFKVLHAMDRMRAAGATVVFVHHLRKETKKIILAEDIDIDARGSSSITAHYDCHIGFRATRTEENLVMHVVGKHLEPHSYAVTWDIKENDPDPTKDHALVKITKIVKKEGEKKVTTKKAKPRDEEESED